jgi:hypothetical protein
LNIVAHKDVTACSRYFDPDRKNARVKIPVRLFEDERRILVEKP